MHGSTHERRDEAANGARPFSFTVIIPAYNASRTISRCLESVVALDWPNFEIVVVDDASTDGTPEIAARFPCRVVRLSRNVGPGLARNAGAREANGELLAFTDSDCVVPRGWLRRFAPAFELPGVVGVTGGYSGTVGDTVIERYQLHSLAERQRHLPAAIESTITSNLACRRSAFMEVGGFPEYYLRGMEKPVWGNEDEELGYLLSRNGRVLWTTENGVTHHFRSSLTGLARQQIWYAERIMLSQCLFPAMRSTSTNYSRLGVVLNVACALAIPGLAAFVCVIMQLLAVFDAPAIELSTSRAAVATILLTSGLAWLSIQFRSVRYFRSRGESWGFVLAALVLSYLNTIWTVYGSLRGLILSRRGTVGELASFRSLRISNV